jgi:hypothetical protein
MPDNFSWPKVRAPAINGLNRLSTNVEGSCKWKLSSGNSYTFIRSNQEQLRKRNYRFLAGIEPGNYRVEIYIHLLDKSRQFLPGIYIVRVEFFTAG